MLISKQGWTIDRSAAASSGAQAAVEMPTENVTQAVMYVDHSTLATTNSVSFQSAQQSSGPYFIEGSTQLATGNVSTNFAMRVTGPIGPFVRPYVHTASSGGYDFLLIGVA